MAEQTRMRSTYVYGNTVPAYNPELEQEEAYRRALRRKRIQEEEELAARRRRHRILEREKKISRANMVVMTMATVMILGLCAVYIHLISQLNIRMNKVASLESQLINLTEENDSLEKSIETSVDLEQIRKTAIKELGMVYPEEDQIVYYQLDNNDYMEQYKDIPSGNSDTIFGMIFGN
ncbi:MAG: hypothetical protein ACI39H_07515 [Lachnospiraceae bacterium]